MPDLRTIIATTTAAATLASQPAIAAPPTPSVAPVVSQVIACRAMTDSVARLACYDKAVDEVAKAASSGDLVTLDREQRRTVRRQAFGLTLPSLAMFDRGEKGDEANRLTDVVEQAFRAPDGKWIVRLKSGATWRQTDDTELFKTPHPGSTVVVRKGTLGSFFMNIDGVSDFRAHRDN